MKHNDIEVCLGSDRGGTFVEWYKEDEDGAGWTSRWYGSFTECVARRDGPPPKAHEFHPMTGESGPPYDAATEMGLYDSL